MTVRTDIAAIRADGTKTERQKELAVYAYKNAQLRDVIVNGKPAPNPIPPLLNRTFTQNGIDVRVNGCSLVNRLGDDGATVEVLYINVTLTPQATGIPITHQLFLVNPPVIPESETGNEKQDLIAAATEILMTLPTAA